MSNEELRIMPGNFGLDQCEHSDFEAGPYSEIPVGGPHKRWVRVKPAEWEKFLATAPAAHPTSSAPARPR